MPNSTYRKKLIEVALPLEAINKASAREKSIRHGHPSTLHLWWARRPLAACRAVLFASLVNDPEDDPMYGIDENTAYSERAKLFDLIEDLVQWENSNNPTVINRARLEIARSIAANKVADKELTDDALLVANAPDLPEEQAKCLPDPPLEYTLKDVRFKMPSLTPAQVNHFLAHYAPPVLDPFAGGGSIPLEAQRLGLRAYASDLNPVPVLINKALIEIPSKFAGQPPVNPDARKARLKTKQWNGAKGLAEDVRYYGKWMRDEAEKRIGHLFPKVQVTQEMVDDGRPDLEPYVGRNLTVISWIWARTIPSPNPAMDGARTPLISTFHISRKAGNEAWIEASLEPANKSIKYHVHHGAPPQDKKEKIAAGTKIGRGEFGCLWSNKAPIPKQHIKGMGREKRIQNDLICVVLAGNRKRLYVDPVLSSCPAPPPTAFLGEIACPEISGYFNPPIYGFDSVGSLFSDRQRYALETFSSLVPEAVSHAALDGATQEYQAALASYLSLAVGRLANRNNSFCVWDTGYQKITHTFSEQGVGMAWDWAEANPLGDSTGNWEGQLSWIPKIIERSEIGIGNAIQHDAALPRADKLNGFVVSTDPPYYSSLTYADFADVFYGLLRKSLLSIYPESFSTIATPKADEIVAAWHRYGGDRAKASHFFTSRLSKAFTTIREEAQDDCPTVIYYAFKQRELEGSGSGLITAWESILEVVLASGLGVVHTWPVRTELTGGKKSKKNTLASSIVIVCRNRSVDAAVGTRRELAIEMQTELKKALRDLQMANLVPIDLQQSIIGPGMAVFSRFSKVVNADGSPMSVREALQLINQMLDESLVEQESDFDSETRFAIKWFEQFGMQEGAFGDANTLANAMALSVDGVVQAGIAKSGAGKVRLLKREELDPDWNPKTDIRLTMWEVTQYLIHRLETGGEMAAAELVRDVSGERGEIAKELAYRLYQTCDRKKWAEEARRYNAFVASWPEIVRLSRQKSTSSQQAEMF